MELVLALAGLTGSVLLITHSLAKKGTSYRDILAGNVTLAKGSNGGGSTPTAAAGSAPVVAATGSAAPLPQNTALTGSNATAWAQSVLSTLGAPATHANLASMVAWFAREGGGGQNNPLNTTLNTTGATGSINSVGVKNYGSVSNGIGATVQTLEGGYPAIVAALKSGSGLATGNPGVSSELYTWSGGGYSSLG